MRGGINYAEALSMSFSDLKLIDEIIESNLETTKKTGMNFF
jgi:hypothetical protein|tara:strand:+ start:1454 stop:1576 length:123 start_codon:yes stop_codon:yes gene_type:complete